MISLTNPTHNWHRKPIQMHIRQTHKVAEPIPKYRKRIVRDKDGLNDFDGEYSIDDVFYCADVVGEREIVEICECQLGFSCLTNLEWMLKDPRRPTGLNGKSTKETPVQDVGDNLGNSW